MKFAVKFAVMLTVLCSSWVEAGTINLGQAANYNVFVKENFSAQTADTEGAAAIGGNLVVDGGYDFGYVNKGTANTVTVAGNVLKSGGGYLNIYNGNGNQSLGNLTYGGTLSNTGGGIGASSTVNSNSSVNFNTAFAQLEALSANLAAQTQNTTRNEQWGTLTFKPAVTTTNDVYVFNLTQADLNNNHTVKIDNTNISKDALIVFNISNTAGVTSTKSYNQAACATGSAGCVTLSELRVEIGNVETSRQLSNGRTYLDQNILFNFNGVNDLRIDSSIYGSVLAPKAAISAKGGVLWGQVMANSWKGNQQINWSPLDVPNTPPTVSAPPAWTLFGLACLMMLRRRKHSQQLTPAFN